MGLRDRTMLEVLDANGLRVAEPVSLKVAHVSLNMRSVGAAGRGKRWSE